MSIKKQKRDRVFHDAMHGNVKEKPVDEMKVAGDQVKTGVEQSPRHFY